MKAPGPGGRPALLAVTGLTCALLVSLAALANCRFRVPPPKRGVIRWSPHKNFSLPGFPPSVRVAGTSSQYVVRQFAPAVLPALAATLKGGRVAAALLLGCEPGAPFAADLREAGVEVRVRPRACTMVRQK